MYQDNTGGINPPVQIGLNGKSLNQSIDEKKYSINNHKVVRLDSAYKTDHALVKRSCSQIKNEETTEPIEILIDDINWKAIFRSGQSKCQDSQSSTHVNKLQQLASLEDYVFREENQVVPIDGAVWNNKSIMHLLLECYPETTATENVNASDAFASRAVKILPQFNQSDSSVEQNFIRQVENLHLELGIEEVTPTQHTFVVAACDYEGLRM